MRVLLIAGEEEDEPQRVLVGLLRTEPVLSLERQAGMLFRLEYYCLQRKASLTARLTRGERKMKEIGKQLDYLQRRIEEE